MCTCVLAQIIVCVSQCVSVCTLGINIIHILLYLHNNKAADAGTSTAAAREEGGGQAASGVQRHVFAVVF